MRELILEASNAEHLRVMRRTVAAITGTAFRTTGLELRTTGHIFGPDRKSGASPFQHGTDEVVGVGTILTIGSQLVDGYVVLNSKGLAYSAAALLRQMVEVEYLAWAFEARDQDAERWLRSDKNERINFFSPRKLRDAAGDRFRAVDYSFHCELGGHPTPGSRALLTDDDSIAELLLADLLSHAGRIWDHACGWGKTSDFGVLLHRHSETMGRHYATWKDEDPLATLPPPPLE